MFFCEIYEIFKDTFFTENLWATASEPNKLDFTELLLQSSNILTYLYIRSHKYMNDEFIVFLLSFQTAHNKDGGYLSVIFMFVFFL